MRRSSAIVRGGVQTAGPLALLAATFLFFAGHNRPGGGFSAGLVLGAVVALRAVAGLSRPRHAAGLLTGGVLVVGAVALAPLLAGDTLLDQVVLDREIELLGKVKSGSALVFDAGVTAVVLGLVVAVIDGLGAGALGDDATEDPA